MLYNKCPQYTKKNSREQKKSQIGAALCTQNKFSGGRHKKFSDHFIAGLCSVDTNFIMYLWGRIIPLETINLNLPIPERINPRISDQEILNGVFEYNRTPLAPPGARVVVHDMLSKRAILKPNEKNGLYLDSAPDYYRCHKTHIK